MMDEHAWGGGRSAHRGVGPPDVGARERGWPCGAGGGGSGRYRKNDSESLQ